MFASSIGVWGDKSSICQLLCDSCLGRLFVHFFCPACCVLLIIKLHKFCWVQVRKFVKIVFMKFSVCLFVWCFVFLLWILFVARVFSKFWLIIKIFQPGVAHLSQYGTPDASLPFLGCSLSLDSGLRTFVVKIFFIKKVFQKLRALVVVPKIRPVQNVGPHAPCFSLWILCRSRLQSKMGPFRVPIVPTPKKKLPPPLGTMPHRFNLGPRILCVCLKILCFMYFVDP